MADTREIRIYIEGGSSKATQMIPSAGNADLAASKARAGTGDAISSTTSTLGSVLANQAFEYVKKELGNELEYEIGKAITMRDDYVAQRRLSATYSIASKGASAYAAVAGGYEIGSSLGIAYGGPIGAALAAIGIAASIGVDIYQNYDRQRIAINKQEAQLDYLRQRAGYSLTSGSIGEDR